MLTVVGGYFVQQNIPGSNNYPHNHPQIKKQSPKPSPNPKSINHRQRSTINNVQRSPTFNVEEHRKLTLMVPSDDLQPCHRGRDAADEGRGNDLHGWLGAIGSNKNIPGSNNYPQNHPQIEQPYPKPSPNRKNIPIHPEKYSKVIAKGPHKGT